MLNPHSVIKYRTYTAVSQQKKIHIDLFPAITYYKYRSPHLLGNAERGGEYFYRGMLKYADRRRDAGNHWNMQKKWSHHSNPFSALAPRELHWKEATLILQ